MAYFHEQRAIKQRSRRHSQARTKKLPLVRKGSILVDSRVGAFSEHKRHWPYASKAGYHHDSFIVDVQRKKESAGLVSGNVEAS